ncbi:unnamed protein product [Moneuplotes crassus]|uniref:Uncharacterized protein n=1 Tax=Euplotes crassus TaxID=5936 RepID=A0AAD2D8D7_EUPCR|nr:unnamed protein product [Moneuplotes crassus]
MEECKHSGVEGISGQKARILTGPEFGRLRDCFKPRPKSSVKRILEEKDHIKNIENFMEDMHLKSFKNSFFQKIKFFIVVFSVVIVGVGIGIHFYMEDDPSTEIGRNRCLFSGLIMAMFYIILEYFPSYHGVICPAILIYGFICVSDIYKSSDRYLMHEYALPTIGKY